MDLFGQKKEEIILISFDFKDTMIGIYYGGVL